MFAVVDFVYSFIYSLNPRFDISALMNHPASSHTVQLVAYTLLSDTFTPLTCNPHPGGTKIVSSKCFHLTK